jgi:hypothetical protein
MIAVAMPTGPPEALTPFGPVRCWHCRRLLAETLTGRLEIQCPRCERLLVFELTPGGVVKKTLDRNGKIGPT